MNVSELDFLSQTKDIDRTKLIDIQNIIIDQTQTADLRMKSYLEQIKNPYCFLCNDSVVRVSFQENGTELKNKLKNYLISKKKI